MKKLTIIFVGILSLLIIMWGLYLNFAPINCPDYVGLMPFVSIKQSILHKLCPNSLVVQ